MSMVAVEFHALGAVFVGLESDLSSSGSINSELIVASIVLFALISITSAE
jgi:hypothetical protein